MLWAVGVLLAWALTSSSLISTASAAPLPRAATESIPEALRPWMPWVLQTVPEAHCTQVPQHRQCIWSGPLQLSTTERGARFEQELIAEAPTWLSLPGSAQAFPVRVELDGEQRPVVARNGAPHIQVPAGRHQLRGRFVWSSLPQWLALPQRIGWVELSVAGVVQSPPVRDADNRVRLGQTTPVAQQSEQSLNLQVSRRLVDSVPQLVETHLRLEVSGPSRPVRLPSPLLAGTQAYTLESALAARITPEGDLLLSVEPGTHEIEIAARSLAPQLNWTLASRPAPWPEREVWTFLAEPAIRDVQLSGATRVDPSQANLPSHWRSLPTFELLPGGSLNLTEVRRGQPTAPPHSLELHRELWLDLDGQGFTVQDRFSGSLGSALRLNLTEGTLGAAQVDGQWIAFASNSGSTAPGVELRNTTLNLTARSRRGAEPTIAAVGWSEDVTTLTSRLHLPASWDLLAATGVDTVDNTWVGRWDLWDLFYVLLVALTVARLSSPRWGVLAIVTLLIGHHAADAPRYVWSVLVVLWALLRVAPGGWVRAGLHTGFWVAWTVFALQTVPYAVRQLDLSLFPILQSADSSGGTMPGAWQAPMGSPKPHEDLSLASSPEAEPPSAPSQPRRSSLVKKRSAPRAKYAEMAEGVGQGFGSGSPSSRPVASAPRGQAPAQPVDPDAVVQTGPGLPRWEHRSWDLVWSGPVTTAQTVRLYLMPPWLNRGLRLLGVLLLLVLASKIYRETPRPPSTRGDDDKPATPLPKIVTAASVLLPALAILLGVPTPAMAAPTAGYPSPELLQELRQRLTQPPQCAPNCVSIPRALLTVQHNELSLTLHVHAADWTHLPLPDTSDTWAWQHLLVDERPARHVARLADKLQHLRVAPGTTVVQLRGPVRSESVSLQFALTPYLLETTLESWQLSGLSEDGRVQGPLQLQRLVNPSQPESQQDPAAPWADGTPGDGLPEWLELQRTLRLDVRWTMTSTLRRRGATSKPSVVRIALLPGETVGDAAVTVDDQSITVSFAQDDVGKSWESTFPIASQSNPTTHRLQLLAPPAVAWTEQWTVGCSALWKCTTEGLVPLGHEEYGTAQWRFAPWPGEQLTLEAERVRAAPGQSLTIESVQLTSTPGSRLQEASLDLFVRTTATEQQPITLPPGAEVRSLTVDGLARPIGPSTESISVTLSPGEHPVHLQWRQQQATRWWQPAPRVQLGETAHNISWTLNLPEDRWILWTSGPAWGPAVLFWPRLLLVIALAWFAARVPHSPLRTSQWALLGLGLLGLPAALGLGVVGWLYLVGHRQRVQPLVPWKHNGLQLLTVGSTLVALGLLVAAVYRGLLLRPPTQVQGASSTETALRWYVDRADILPQPSVLSAPLWVWRVVMLLWALWLAAQLVQWLAATWRALTVGRWWLPRRKPAKKGKAAKSPDPKPPTPDAEQAASEDTPISE